MFYAKLSLKTMRQNQVVYLPFLIALIFLVASNVLMHNLVANEAMTQITTGGGVAQAFQLGEIVIVLFTLIFLIYANNFVQKERYREFGLFRILGLSKKDLYLLSIWELLLLFGFALVVGVISGLVFSRFAFLVLKKMFGLGTKFSFQVHFSEFPFILGLFFLLFGLLVIINCRKIAKSDPLAFFSGAKQGETEPRARWIWTALGVLFLAIGYGLALTIEQPMQALFRFTFAVVLVILATYLLFISGSITLLKKLKKRSKIYYQPRFFVNISNMLYRMKQNGAGLASICILSTMALITVATTASLYFGRNASIDAMYPYDFKATSTIPIADWRKNLDEIAQAEEIELVDPVFVETTMPLLFAEHKGIWSHQPNEDTAIAQGQYFMLITNANFEKLVGENSDLKDNEIKIISSEPTKKVPSKLTFSTESFSVKKTDQKFPKALINDIPVTTNLVVVKDQMILDDFLRKEAPSAIEGEINLEQQILAFDFKTANEAKRAAFVERASHDFSQFIQDKRENLLGSYSYGVNSKDQIKADNRAFDSSFFFIGILLSILFLAATTLIIYFKQITEGMEDRERFQVMQQVGMSHAEVKKTIHQQVWLIFFLPLLVTLLHVAVAFPMMTKLLALFAINQTQIFLLATLLVAADFVLIYLLVYFLTARVYYRLVER